jgi:hypothetical protein
MVRKTLAVLVACGLLAQNAAFARQTPGNGRNQVQIYWDELPNFVVEQRVSIALPDGARLEGEVLAVRPDSLVLDVQKVSHTKSYQRGQTEIPRASISDIQVIRHQSSTGRIVGGILGVVGGFWAIGGLAYATDSAAVVVPGLILILPASAVAGYYAGKLADRRVTRLAVRGGTSAPGTEEE